MLSLISADDPKLPQKDIYYYTRAFKVLLRNHIASVLAQIQLSKDNLHLHTQQLQHLHSYAEYIWACNLES